MINRFMLGAAVLGAVAVAAQAEAATVVREVAVANADFENPVLAEGAFTPNTVVGWGSYGGSASSGTFNTTTAQAAAAPSGQNVAYLNSFVLNGTSEGGFFQEVAERPTAGTTYDLSVQVGRRADIGPSGVPYQLGNWRMQLLSGTDLLAEGTYADADVAGGTYRRLNIRYTAAVDGFAPLRINFQSFYDPAQNGEVRQVLLDDVRLTATSDVTAAVPEPASWALMIGGFGAVGGAARRRRVAVRFA